MSEIAETRIQELNHEPVTEGKYVLYWMQQAQRTRYNHALEFAVQMANELAVPLVVCFGLTDKFPEANYRHYYFLLEGLRDVSVRLKESEIAFVVRLESPPKLALQLGEKACAVICDRGYLRIQKQWRRDVAAGATCAVYQIESDVVVPVEMVSDKSEYAARTIRPKLHKLLTEYLKPMKSTRAKHSSLKLKLAGEDLSDIDALISKLRVAKKPGSVAHIFSGGEVAAQKNLKRFLKNKFDGYKENRNHPGRDYVSHLGMYLHYGHISALDIALQANEMPRSYFEEKEVFLEELIVRRELGINFVHYNPEAYDTYDVLPHWTRATMEKHASDEREFLYTEEEFESARTHDIYWNACMMEMRIKGYMHNYMRMYWGKKVLEWSASPQEAYRILLKLNNKYFLCGRDPLSFSNVLWVFGLHDRPWGERAVYGMIRSMAASGLERKTDIMAYVNGINALTEK